MSRCHNRCVTVSGTTNEEIWQEIRLQLGPTNVTSSAAVTLMNSQIAEYNTWVSTNGSVPFDKWLLWYINIGTTNYANLPKDKKHDGKVGHCYAPCPYSTQATALKTRHLLGLTAEDVLPTKVTHEVMGVTYYMKTANRGSRWGFECTYDGCSHYIITGERYFYT